MIAFPLRMAWRETRAAWRHFLYFLVCIALGVGALVGVGLFATSIEHTVAREARALQGGDVQIRMSRALSDQGLGLLDSLSSRGIVWSHVSELVAMAAVPKGTTRTTQIIELKAIPPRYPFYGRVETTPAGSLRSLLAERGEGCRPPPCWGALVQESLLIRMGVSVGDEVRIGQADFVITGLLQKEPDRVANVFSLGPRVLISRAALAATELVKPGSRVRERYLLKVPAELPLQSLVYELRGRLTGESARITTYRNAQPTLKRFLDQLARYFGLIGLTALFVGGIGVASTIQAFMRKKLHTIAVLKTLGASSGSIMRTYLLQALTLGTIGSLAGAALGLGLQAVFPAVVSRVVPWPLLHQIELSSVTALPSLLVMLKGVSLGLLTTALFAAWPLLAVRDVRPALVFRREITTGFGAQPCDPQDRRGWRQVVGLDDPLRVGTAVAIAVGLGGLAIWQAGAWAGLVFIVALAAAVAVLASAAFLIVRVLARVPAPRSLALRQAVRNIHRPGSQAAGVTVAIGIGVMVIVAVSLMEHSLVRQVSESRPSDAPTFFFIDIQPDQREGFVRLITDWTGGTAPEMTPLIRSRLHAVDGTPVAVDGEGAQAPDDRRDGRTRWFRTREYVLTFLEALPKDNVIVQGEWWRERAGPPPRPLVSVEQEAARHLGIEVGSSIELDVQGTTVAATVASIRRVDWGNLSTNFYMILSPGSLEGAPFTYVATVGVPREKEVPLQQAIVAAYPNVTAINIVDVMERFARILDRLALAIRTVALFCVVAGAVVMATALSATKYRRVYECAVLKALGSTRALLARSFAAEYALLGGVAGLIGVGLAAALSWGVLHFFLEVPWLFQPDVLVAGLVWTVVLAVLVGFVSTFHLLGQRPLPVLRHD